MANVQYRIIHLVAAIRRVRLLNPGASTGWARDARGIALGKWIWCAAVKFSFFQVFVVNRRELADGSVATAELGEGLDPFERDLAGVVVILEVVAGNECDFEEGKEGFGASVSGGRFAG